MKRLYRVVAHYGDEVRTRDYQSMRAARHRAAVVTQPDREFAFPSKADRAEIWVSDPIVFSDGGPRTTYQDGVYS